MINKFGIPLREVGNRLDSLNKELKKYGMAILADSEGTLEFDDPTREVVTGLTLRVALFEKPFKENPIVATYKKIKEMNAKMHKARYLESKHGAKLTGMWIDESGASNE